MMKRQQASLAGCFVLMGAALAPSFLGCAKTGSTENQSNQATDQAAQQRQMRECRAAAWQKIYQSYASGSEDRRRCFVQKEREFRANGRLANHLSCGRQSFVMSDRETLARVCSDEIPRACGVGPESVQEAMAREEQACASLYTGPLTPMQQCLKNEEQKAHEDGSLPRRLRCGVKVIGAADQRLLEEKCEDFLNTCNPSLRNFDSSGFIQDAQGRNLDVRVASNPACAPNNRAQFNADCSVMHTSHGVYQLTNFQRCMNRKQVELQRTGGAFNLGTRKLDCGMMATQLSDQRVITQQCDRITNECRVEVPNYVNEQMQKLEAAPESQRDPRCDADGLDYDTWQRLGCG